MFESIIIVDPRGELKGNRGIDTYVLSPSDNKLATIRIDDIRDLLHWSRQTSFQQQTRTIIIEDLQRSSDAVPHALLKLLEEPPLDLQIVITVSQIEEVLPTILSRCAVRHAEKVSDDELARLHLNRQRIRHTRSNLGWEEFLQMPELEKLQWASSFTKKKQDASALLSSWRRQILDNLHAIGNSQSISLNIQYLHALESTLESLSNRVLPRLAWQAFILRLHRISI